MATEDHRLFESTARKKYGWDDNKLRSGPRGHGFYADPLTQVAFDFWMASIDANKPQTEKPKGIHGFYQGIGQLPRPKGRGLPRKMMKRKTMALVTFGQQALPRPISLKAHRVLARKRTPDG